MAASPLSPRRPHGRRNVPSATNAVTEYTVAISVVSPICHVPVAPGARRSHGLSTALVAIGFALGGEAGSRLATTLGIPTSGDTLLRLVCAAPPAKVESPRVLGIDDWAWRKATRYGTILCDLERHRAVDLLPDRPADTVAAWLGVHPSVGFIARDRSDLYADGATRGAPTAVQVADRFHLLKNLGDALERFLQQKRAALKQAIAGPTPLPPPRLQPWQERMERESEGRHAPWIARYERVIALRANDAAITDLAREVGHQRDDGLPLPPPRWTAGT
ncbi:MAG: transposase [Thermomicrobiales bacterium]